MIGNTHWEREGERREMQSVRTESASQKLYYVYAVTGDGKRIMEYVVLSYQYQ